MIQLPRSAGLMAKLAARSASRYTLEGVQVAANGTEYKLIATDGHVLGVLRGSVIPPGMEACVIVPISAWEQAFKFCPKDSGHIELHQESLVAIGKARTEVPFDAIKGHFPDWMRVMPKTAPLLRMKVNPAILVRLLQVADAVAQTHQEFPNTVELFFYAATTPMGVVAIGKDVTFDGLCMPLA